MYTVQLRYADEILDTRFESGQILSESLDFQTVRIVKCKQHCVWKCAVYFSHLQIVGEMNYKVKKIVFPTFCFLALSQFIRHYE